VLLAAWILLAAIVLLVWLGLTLATILIALARFSELRSTGRFASRNSTVRTEWSVADAKFLSSCGIGVPRQTPIHPRPVAHRLH
jgi:hypothetical protein